MLAIQRDFLILGQQKYIYCAFLGAKISTTLVGFIRLFKHVRKRGKQTLGYARFWN